MIIILKFSCRGLSSINSGYIAALYPQLHIDPLKEVRPVDSELRQINDQLSILLLRLPESDQIKSNVKRISIDSASVLDQLKPLEFEVMMSSESGNEFVLLNTN